ncbi:MAG: hypothetical protein E7589_03960 [Ruminococcaceae bacterium]|nr:hypothetical protein [Oscillospiraceae bacterium]
MKAMKIFKKVATVGASVAAFGSTVIDAADRLIHYKEYKEAKRRRKIRNIIIGVCIAVLAVLFIPYRVVINPNGEYEIRTLLLNISRKHRTDLGECDASFDIEGVEDVEAVEAE